jgi:hypothetical protein
LLATLLAVVTGGSCPAADEPPALAGPVIIHPPTLVLRHPRQPHSLQVLGATADGYSLDLRAQARLASADPKVAMVDEQGWVRPIGSGRTQVTIAIAGQTLTVPVDVQLPASEPLYSFRHEVMTVFSKAGCNSGACHGYSLGKNGFKLSLRGADPEQDYDAITREFSGRRLNYLSPESSLLVAKPRGDMPHEGGVRFGRDSLLNAGSGRQRAAGAGKAGTASRSEASAATDRYLHRREHARRHPSRRLHREQRPVFPGG